MTPTPQLRFVEKDVMVPHPQHDNIFETKKLRVLQQFWIPSDEPYQEWLKIKDGEWRDVPLEAL